VLACGLPQCTHANDGAPKGATAPPRHRAHTRRASESRKGRLCRDHGRAPGQTTGA